MEQSITPRSKRVLVVVLAVLFITALYPVDKLLSRPDRMECSRRERDLRTVRDELLRYQYENGTLPNGLETMIPAYLRRDQLYDGERAMYVYSRQERTIALRDDMKVRGLFSRTLPAIVYPLPEAKSTKASEEAGDIKPSVEPVGLVEVTCPKGPNGVPAPEGALVFEAEHYSETNYGWEIRPDASCSGGAYIHSKEGIANSQGQIDSRIFDFYNVREAEEYTYLKYHISVPQTGHYYVYGRLWTTSSHCSNTVYLGIDNDWSRARSHRDFSDRITMTNRTPFRWLWTQAGHSSVYLEKGDHVLTFFLHEDGVRLDQLMLCKEPLTGDAMYTPNFEVSDGTRFLEERAPQLHMTIDLKSSVISASMPPRANVFIRRQKACSGEATMTVALDGLDLILGEYRLKLDDLPQLGYLPIDFSKLSFDGLQRREYLLSVRLTQGDDLLASAHASLMHHMQWEISPMIGYLEGFQGGPLDGALSDASLNWAPIKDSSWTHFGVMDFGMQTIGNSLQAPIMKTIYAKTRIHVPKSGEYLLKLQSDDQMMLWIDGKYVYFHGQKAPVTRSAKRLKLKLEKGDHDVRIRVNQRQMDSYGDGRWQAYLRFRSLEDDLCDIRWAPPEMVLP